MFADVKRNIRIIVKTVLPAIEFIADHELLCSRKYTLVFDRNMCHKNL